MSGGASDWERWGDTDPAVFVQYRRLESGRDVVCGLTLRGDVLTADMLRRVPIEQIERTRNLDRPGGKSELAAALEALAPLRRHMTTDPAAFSRLVADHYLVWARYVPNPPASMAAEWDIKPRTMHTWIREARLRGFLPPAKRGKVA